MSTHSSEESTALGGLLHLLGHLLSQELNAELLRVLQEPEVRKVLIQAEPGCADYLEGDWSEERIEAAAVDFCTLFILPKGVSPMASAWCPRGADSETVSIGIQQLVRSLSEQVEIPLPSGMQGIPAEHAGLLLYLGGSLVAADDEALREQALSFLQESTVPWLAKFADRLSTHPLNPLYRAVGVILSQTHTQWSTAAR